MPPLSQDAEARRPLVFDGGALDTITACPPLSIFEQSNFQGLHAKLANILAPDTAKQRAEFVREHAERLQRTRNVGEKRATRRRSAV